MKIKGSGPWSTCPGPVLYPVSAAVGLVPRRPAAPVERIAGGSHMRTAKETPPARRATAIGRWLTGGRARGSRHRDVQGGTTRAAVLGAGDGLLTTCR